MALINKTGITNGGTIQAEHITRAIDALSGGSTDSVSITGSLMGSSSYALTASYALNGGGAVDTASFALSASNAYTASIALTASKIVVSDNSSLTGPQPIMLATGTGATRLVATDTTDFSFNPIGNLLTVPRISSGTNNSDPLAVVTMSASSAAVAATASIATAAVGIAATNNIPVNPVNGTFFMGMNDVDILWIYNDGQWYAFSGTPGTPTP